MIKHLQSFIPLVVLLVVTFFSVITMPLHSEPRTESKNSSSYDRGNFGIFDSHTTEDEIMDWFYREHASWGSWEHIKNARKTRYENTVVMQRSGEKRLFDQNILLAALFQGRFAHKCYGNLKEIFHGSVFVDIGSGILCGKGAPTVRDIFNDDRIWTHLSFIIATDTNAPDCRYIDSYRLNRRDLPFPVRMISMKLIWQRHFNSLTKDLIKENTSLIFRSANAGPDLYYPPHVLIEHFRAISRTYSGRSVLYLYNKFILFKPKNTNYFQKLGEIDYTVGMAHVSRAWEKIDWDKRQLDDFFIPNEELISITH